LITADHYIHIIEPFIVLKEKDRDSENYIVQKKRMEMANKIKLKSYTFTIAIIYIYKKRSLPPYGCLSAARMRLKAVIR